jgi:hypothetical protein
MARSGKSGFKRRSMRQRKADMRTKTINRKRNHEGCGGSKNV